MYTEQQQSSMHLQQQSGYQSQGGYDREYGMMGNSEAMNKKSESLNIFPSNARDFISWSEHFVDHMARVHIQWRQTLEWFSNTAENMSATNLPSETLGLNHENGAELETKLEQTIADWLQETWYRKKFQLCGRREETNGRAMWHKFFTNVMGSGDIVKFAGVETLSIYDN